MPSGVPLDTFGIFCDRYYNMESVSSFLCRRQQRIPLSSTLLFVVVSFSLLLLMDNFFQHEKILGLIKNGKIPEKDANEYLLDFAFGESSSIKRTDTPSTLICKKCCSDDLVFTQGNLTCRDCGVVAENGDIDDGINNINIDIEENDAAPKKKKGSEQYTKVPVFSRYSLDSHMNEILAQRRGKGGTVPPDCFRAVKRQYKIHKIPYEEATDYLTVKYMGLEDYGSYLEHATQITCDIKKVEARWGTEQQDEAIKEMFKQAKRAWQVAPLEVKMIGRKPEDGPRTSFPVYQDFVKRCCIYLGFKDLVAKCKSLKTPHKIEEMNEIWTYFGEYCKWNGYQIALLPCY
jgi:hypothetical protein